MTTTPTSGAADLPEALRLADIADDESWAFVIGVRKEIAAELRRLHALAAGQATAAQQGAAYAAQQASTVTNYTTLGAAMRAIRQSIQMIGDPEDECMRAVKRVLRGAVIIVEDSGDEVAAPAAPAQPAAQHGVAYAALPTSSYAGRVYEEGFLIGTCPLYTADQLRAFADATHALRASHGQAPAGAGMGHTDGGRNMFYEGRFDGESQREQQARLRWANDMRAAFERHTGNGWFDKDWRTETGLWSSAWHACLAAQPTTTAQAADSVQEDAARLDWLESTKQRGHYCGLFSGNLLTRESIDAARAAQKEKQ